MVRVKRMKRSPWIRSIVALCILVFSGCSPSEIGGTYDVEIKLAGFPTTLNGTLVLFAGMLDIPPLADYERAALGDWFISDTLDANSCFILESPSTTGTISQVVRVFEASIQGNEIAVPLEIYRTPAQRIEIIDLKFFANATGGEVVLYDQDEQREGRIGGVRSSSPSAQRCQDGLEDFRAALRASVSN